MVANQDSQPDSDSDEYAFKTSHLNGTINGEKGKGKAQLDGFVNDSDEDLYG